MYQTDKTYFCNSCMNALRVNNDQAHLPRYMLDSASTYPVCGVGLVVEADCYCFVFSFC